MIPHWFFSQSMTNFGKGVGLRFAILPANFIARKCNFERTSLKKRPSDTFQSHLQTTNVWQTSLFLWVEIPTGVWIIIAIHNCHQYPRGPPLNIHVKHYVLATWSASTRQPRLSWAQSIICWCCTKYKCLATKLVCVDPVVRNHNYAMTHINLK